jgi:hypothetical protein
VQETGTLKSAMMEGEEEEDNVHSLSAAEKDFRVAVRKDLDFTDKLWQV